MKPNRKEKFMKRKSLANHLKWLGALVVVFMFSYNNLFAQCTVGFVTVDVIPHAPINFQYFPMSILGVGRAGANLSAFQNFGVSLNNADAAPQSVFIRVGFKGGEGQVFDVPLELRLTVPSGAFFLGIPELLNRRFANAIKSQTFKTAHIDRQFQDKVKGGLPSGTFVFTVETGPDGISYPCSQDLTVTIATGSTVDLILPTNGGEVQSLPQFQWAATGGSKFILTIAKLKNNQTQEDALRTSSQRVVIRITDGNSFQIAPGGAGSEENNLTWSPGLADGAYCYRVTMVQEDPTTGTQNEVHSQIANFTVSGGANNTSGLNTDEIINLLNGALGGVNVGDKLKGYRAISIEIDGKTATIDELREKLDGIKGKAIKVEIKP